MYIYYWTNHYLYSFKTRSGSQFKITCESLVCKSASIPYWIPKSLFKLFRPTVWALVQLKTSFEVSYLASFAEIVSTPNVHQMFNCSECTWNSETQDELCSGRVRSEVKSQVVKESGASEDWSGYLGSATAVALWTSARVHAPQQLLLKPVL